MGHASSFLEKGKMELLLNYKTDRGLRLRLQQAQISSKKPR
jgi:hypothetical protein